METSLNNKAGLTGQSSLRQTDQLRPGTVLHATVESAGKDGRYTIHASGLRLGVESKTPLVAGMKLNLLVTAGKNGGMALQILPDSAQTAARLAAQSSATLTRSLSVNIPSGAVFSLAALYAPHTSSPAALTPQQSEEEEKAAEEEKDATEEKEAAQDPAESEQAEESAGQNRAKGTAVLPADGTRAKALAQSRTAKDVPAPDAKIIASESTPVPVEKPPVTATSSAGTVQSAQTVLRLPTSTTEALRLTLASSQSGQPVLQLPDGEAIPLLPPDVPGETIDVAALLELLGGESASAASSSTGNFTTSALTLFLQTALPDNTTARLNLPLVPADLAKLLAALPAGSLADQNISLQLSASTPGQIEAVIGGQTFPLPSSATGTQLASLLTALPAGATFPASVSANATLDGLLRTTQTEAQTAPTRAVQETPAAALLRSAGLTPSPATLPAAEALMTQRLNVSRENVQTLLALVAGREGEERAALLQAGARLIALEAPVSPALASGMASLLNPARSLAQQTAEVVANLQSAASALPTENATHMNTLARQMETLSVLVGDAETPRALASFTATLGRELMGQVLQGIEQEAARQLGGSPALNALGAALEVVLARLSHLPENVPSLSTSTTLATAQTPAPDAAAGGTPQATPSGGKTGQPSPPPTLALPRATPPAGAATASAAQLPSASSVLPAATDQNSLAPPAVPTAPQAAPAPSATVGVLAERLRVALELFNNKSPLGNAAAEVLAHPGIEDFPDYARPVNPDLRQPANADHERLLASLERIGRARTPAEAAQAAREAVRGMDSATLRELAATLQQAEREEIAQLPGMKQLQDAAADLRELGRAFVAQKAEALALQRFDPAAFQTSVPLRFGEGSADGKLQMFYRRQSGKGKGRDWTQRVVLDLNMSAIGNVVGDLRFYGGQLCVAMLSDDPQTISALEEGAEELRAGLEAAGFPCEPGFRLMKKNEKLLERDLPAPEPVSNQRIDVRI